MYVQKANNAEKMSSISSMRLITNHSAIHLTYLIKAIPTQLSLIVAGLPQALLLAKTESNEK